MYISNSSVFFWRDKLLPFAEVRVVADGRKVSYGKHCHATFSIGAVTQGCCHYLNGTTERIIQAGTVVLFNPDTVHACNPINGQAWSYLMFYLDKTWLTHLQQQMGMATDHFCQFSHADTTDPKLFNALINLYQTLTSDTSLLNKEISLVEFFSQLHQWQFMSPTPRVANTKLSQVADYITIHAQQTMQLADLCQIANLSPYYLIHSFKKHYGISPYAFLINKRIQHSQLLLKQGQTLSEVANNTGFADQAHFQRTFKKLLAVTPRVYQALNRY